MEIGIMGLTFNSPNKGCEALSYGFLEVINKLAKKHNDNIVVNFLTTLPTKLILKKGFKNTNNIYAPKVKYSNITFKCIYYTDKLNRITFLNSIKNCKYVFDFTAGDSFTDIYGQARFYSRTKVKQAVIDKNIKLVIASQTIGPFNDKKVQQVAADVINKAYEVHARDEMSYDYTIEIAKRTPKLTTDIAFYLPYKKLNLNGDKIKIGFNPSGLLWEGGYTKDNQFGLTVNYRDYCRQVIKNLLDTGYEVHLIPHAFTVDKASTESDLVPAKILKEEFPQTILNYDFKTAIDVKSYIASMDLFMGARMHATIAATSAGVSCIPFSYSRKFEGLYESLNYSRVIHGCSDTTEYAIKTTLLWVDNYEELKKEVKLVQKLVEQKNQYIYQEYENLLYKL